MELKTYFAQDRNGSLIPSANVAIYLTGTTTLATGLKTVSGANLDNPFTAGTDGKIQFYAPDGLYDMQVSLGSTTGVKVTFQCLDVQEQLSGANSAADRAEAAAESIEGQASSITANTREQWRRTLAEAGLNLADGSFEEGATASTATDAVWHIEGGQCYTWSGTLPKAVPANSTPESTGGIGLGTWVSVGDASLRTEITSDSGLSIIGTNHRGTLQADLDRIDNRTSGQSIADLKSNTGDIVIDTSVTSPLSPVANSHITGNSGGELVTAKATTALSGSANRVTVNGLLARGDGTVNYDDISPTYTFSLSGPDTTYFNCYAKDATMGFDLRTGADHVKVIGCRTENMTSHPNLGGTGLSAGGYGVLLNGNTDVFILGHSSKGTNPADRHVLYLSNTNTATPNKDVRAIGVRGDFTAVSQGDKPEMHSPMVFGRNNQGVIVDASQFRGGGGGFNWTDERGTYEMISISNTQLNDIRKNDAVETCGIAFNHAESTNPGQINHVLSVSNVQMSLTDGGKGADRSNQFPLLFNSSKYVNVNNVSFGCSGKAYGIRLIKTSYANISNIVGWTNDGTPAAEAAAFIQFMQGSSNIKLSNINPQSRLKMFDGLDQVTDLQVDWVRKVRINVVSGVASVSDDTWELVSNVVTGSSSIVVTLKPHVTQLAADGALVRAASGNQFVVTGTGSKTLTISVYNVNGTGVVPNTGTYSFDVILYQ